MSIGENMLKKMIFLIGILLLFGVVYGYVWSDTRDNIEDAQTTNDITETFNFPYNLEDIEVQSMEVEVEAYGVSIGSDYDETVWIYNSSNEKEHLGDIPYGVSYKKFIINNPAHYAYNYSNKFEIYLEFNTSKTKNVTITFYNINGSTYSESSNKKSSYYVYFPWHPENTSKVEIIIRKKFGGDCVFVDGDYVGILNEGDSITSFTIDKENATNYLSDGSISVFIDKSNDYIDDKIQINKITVKVYYLNKSDNIENNGSGETSTKAPMPFGAIALSLIGILLLLVRHYEN